MKNIKSYYLFIIVIAVFALQNQLHSQPSVVWTALYNGPANQQDSGVGSCLSPNGAMYFVTGWSLGTGTSADIVTIRYNPDTGDTMWVNRYSGTLEDKVTAITCDNNAVYVTGWSFTPSRDIITIKYDAANGNRLWVRTYNGTGNGGDYGFAIEVTSSGNVFVTGRSDITAAQKYTTLGYDASGNVLSGWPQIYTGVLSTTADEAHAIRVDGSGNVYVTGKSGTGGLDDWLTLKYNSGGVLQWAKKYNGTANGEDNAIALVLNSAGTNVYAGGYSTRTALAQDYLVIRYTASTGDSTAAVFYSGPAGNSPDVMTSMTIDAANNIYVTGASTDITTTLDYATLKYDPNLIQLWLRRTTNTGIDIPRSIALDNASGNVYVTGSSAGTGYDYLTISYRNDGTFNWEKRENGTANSNDYASSVAVADSQRIFVSGSANFSGIGIAFYTLRYSKIVGIQPISTEIPSSFALKQNYPNPFNPSTAIRFDIPKSTYVKIAVYDVMGQEVSVLANENVSAGKYELKWNASGYSSGIYFYTLTAGDFRETKKMILAK